MKIGVEVEEGCKGSCEEGLGWTVRVPSAVRVAVNVVNRTEGDGAAE